MHVTQNILIWSYPINVSEGTTADTSKPWLYKVYLELMMVLLAVVVCINKAKILLLVDESYLA